MSKNTQSVTIQFNSSQPLTPKQRAYLSVAVNQLLENLPTEDFENFLDIPEWTTSTLCDQESAKTETPTYSTSHRPSPLGFAAFRQDYNTL